MKKCQSLAAGLAMAAVVGIAAANCTISRYGQYTTFSVSELKPVYCAILLGTSKRLRGGQRNLYYQYRIVAARELYLSGKCKKIIVSGDNGTQQYNEPLTMKKDLIKLGVKQEDIICDYAGFRTLDSILRFKEIFGQSKGIVISQRFHNARAIYIGRAYGMELHGYNARDVDVCSGLKTRMRELLSRAVCVLDMQLLHTQPRYLGEKIDIQGKLPQNGTN